MPILAERIGSTLWNPHPITERFSLFALVLVRESLLASTNVIIEAVETAEDLAPLIALAALGLTYGYGHYFIFAAAGAAEAHRGVGRSPYFGL